MNRESLLSYAWHYTAGDFNATFRVGDLLGLRLDQWLTRGVRSADAADCCANLVRFHRVALLVSSCLTKLLLAQSLV